MPNQSKFTLNDFRRQMIQLSGRRPLLLKFMKTMPEFFEELTKMLESGEMQQGIRSLVGIIDSMTQVEREDPQIIDESRRRRIAAGAGAGVEPQAVADLVKQFYGMAATMEKTTVSRPLPNWESDIRRN